MINELTASSGEKTKFKATANSTIADNSRGQAGEKAAVASSAAGAASGA